MKLWHFWDWLWRCIGQERFRAFVYRPVRVIARALPMKINGPPFHYGGYEILTCSDQETRRYIKYHTLRVWLGLPK